MNESEADSPSTDRSNAKHSLRLPKFITKESVGAGQVVKRITGLVGVTPCKPCEERADRLDQWLRIEPGTKKWIGE
jgi:hypothetical protein